MKAIPTQYRGLQMRSRLEAKWACYFDLRGDCTWQYEPIDLAGWIPDFSLVMPHKALRKPFLAEVKPVFDYKDFKNSEDGRKVIKAIACLGSDEFAKRFSAFLLLGVSPQHVWFWPHKSGDFFHIPQTIKNVNELWAAACNSAQWKAPI
jgi:hypothetical protein